MTYKPPPPKADPEQAGQARTPCFENVLGFVFVNLTVKHAYNLNLVNIQCLQYVYYSLLLVQKHKVCV